MKSIPIVCKTASTINAFRTACDKSSKEFVPVVLDRQEEVVSYFNYELPEIKIIDFGDDQLDAEALMQVIHGDPWLLYGGIIAIVKNYQQKTSLEKQRDPNILLVLTRSNFEENTDRILRILTRNTQFLFNRGMQQQMNTNETGSFVSDNDPTDILFYCNLITGYLYNTNRVNDEGRSALQGALMELLLNAVEHGNCKIGYDEKTAWLSAGKNTRQSTRKSTYRTTYRTCAPASRYGTRETASTGGRVFPRTWKRVSTAWASSSRNPS